MPGIFESELTDENVLTVWFKNVRAGWSQRFLLSADRHHDNPDCARKLEKRHLDEVKEVNAGIIDCGDLFCCMQGKYDKRADKSKLRPENQVSDYFDSLIREADSFYGPYKENFLCLGTGNHETSILHKHEIDLTKRLGEKLGVPVLGYSGAVRFMFVISNTQRVSKVLWFTHGYGSGGPVTEDMIQSNRQRVYIDSADIMLSGHVHRSWIQEYIKLYVNDAGKLKRRTGWYVKTPTYKDEYKTGKSGFTAELGMGPRPLGAWWLEFYYARNDINIRIYKAD